jgi:hypothetical protein
MSKNFVCDCCGGSIYDTYVNGVWTDIFYNRCHKHFSIDKKIDKKNEPRVDSLPADVQNVMVNGTTVIVTLTDGIKGVAKCGYMDEFDPYVGFVLAYHKCKNGKNGSLKKVLEGCIKSADKKGYKLAILKNYDEQK